MFLILVAAAGPDPVVAFAVLTFSDLLLVEVFWGQKGALMPWVIRVAPHLITAGLRVP